MHAGVPLLADTTFLSAYGQIFNHKHVFVHKHKESQATAMLRVLHMHDHGHMQRRDALVQLRHELQSKARIKLRALIEEAYTPEP